MSSSKTNDTNNDDDDGNDDIWQKGRRHKWFGTSVVKPQFYAYADLIVGAAYTPLALVLLSGTARYIFFIIGIIHVLLLFMTDYKASIPLNIPTVPLIYMNFLDGLVVFCGIALPFLVDGFEGPIKIIFPVASVVLFFAVFIFLDPEPPESTTATAGPTTSATVEKKVK